jgi:ABC-type lipoprotein export system ATPase subunit
MSSPLNKQTVLSIQDLNFGYTANSTVLSIHGFDVQSGERIFLRGASGSGKSTLLGLISGILTPRSGDLEILGQPMQTLSPAERDAFRAAHLGVIFQMFNLLPYLPVGENHAALPVLIRAGAPGGSRGRRTGRSASAAGTPGS